VDAVLGEPPAVLIALRHLLFRALRREDVGRLAAALPRGEIVEQRAARLETIPERGLTAVFLDD